MSGTSTPTLASSDRTWAGLRRSPVTPAGACRSTSASRAARRATASVSLRGRGPIKEVRICSATARSIGSPSADSSAHSSSAVDSRLGRRPAVQPGQRGLLLPGDRAGQSGPPGHPLGVVRPAAADPLGRRCPSGATGSLPSPSSMPNRSSGPSPASSQWPARAAWPRPSRGRPASRRTAAGAPRRCPSTSQAVLRQPPGCAAVWPDHTTHRGRSASSACPTSSTSPGAGRRPARNDPPAVASPRPRVGEMTSPTRSPRLTPPGAATSRGPHLPRTHLATNGSACAARPAMPPLRQADQPAWTRAVRAQAAQQVSDQCSGRVPETHASSGRAPPNAPVTVARAQRIRSAAVSGCSP